jgi:pimeloyl-ACP methyl ester carboxylesterase
MANPVILIHGYSDKGESFRPWADVLTKSGYEVSSIHTCNYKTLTNEVTIRDIAEGFDRALRLEAGLDANAEFDAIVHSTGMLVIRSWLAAYASRRSRLKRLIALAPATFGSPLAHKGRGWLGALFKGEVEGPDFLEAGDLVLDGLELGSRFTWDLAHLDLIGSGKDEPEKKFYGRGADTPYVFVFCGTEGYRGIRSFVNDPGSDGTVRLAGCALNCRKIMMDLTIEPSRDNAGSGSTMRRAWIGPWSSLDVPLIPIDGLNHGTIMSEPNDLLVDLVLGALNVSNSDQFDAWLKEASHRTEQTMPALTKWQQFVVRVIDERGDPVPDYHLQILGGDKNNVKPCDADVHTYSKDTSLRCFHVNLDELGWENITDLQIKLIASSGSGLVEYFGYGSEQINFKTQELNRKGKWDAVIDISEMLRQAQIKFFFPFTTTLIELKVNREPMPLSGQTELFQFVKFQSTRQ